MRFSDACLHNGLGCVTAAGRIYPPPNGPTFAIAAAMEGGAHYYVAELDDSVAILSASAEVGVDLDPGETLRIAKRLVTTGYVSVVWTERGCDEESLRCFSNEPEPHERAAAAMWVLRTRGGWQELGSSLMEVSQIKAVRETPHGTSVDAIAHYVQVTEAESGCIETKKIPIGPLAVSRLPDDALSRGHVAMADIDHFRAYNDAYGHREGDALLRRVLDSLFAVADQFDCDVARVGGDEFVLSARRSEFDAARCAEAMRAAVYDLAIPFEHPEVVIPNRRVTVSVGVPSAGSIDTVRPRLEDAVYEAKAAGRNAIHVASDV